jgi:uncharacterized protein (UPF0276 family)
LSRLARGARENYFVDGGPAIAALEAIRLDYPISLHGVGLSLGSADALDAGHLTRLKRRFRIEPGAVSEHLCWSHVDGRHPTISCRCRSPRKR